VFITMTGVKRQERALWCVWWLMQGMVSGFLTMVITLLAVLVKCINKIYFIEKH
jgi:hypothetical protein